VQPDRRAAIADAGIALVARDGIRALTHRAIDRDLGLAAGSTSYYLRTRRSLIEALVHRLVERTAQGVDARCRPPSTTRRPARRDDRVHDHRPGDRQPGPVRARRRTGRRPELHTFVTSRSPIRAALLERAEQLLVAIGVPDAHRRAPDLIALADGLVHDRLVGSRSGTREKPADLRASLTTVFADYLRGAAK